MKSIFKRFEDLEDRLVAKAFEVYQNSDASYNTDLMINSEGEIKEYNYFGNCEHLGYEFVLKISTQDKMAWCDLWQEGMSEAQREHCENMGWQSCYESDSDNPEDLIEFVVSITDFSDTAVYIGELIEQYEKDLIKYIC
jgi:hypothetical protein